MRIINTHLLFFLYRCSIDCLLSTLIRDDIRIQAKHAIGSFLYHVVFDAEIENESLYNNHLLWKYVLGSESAP